MKRAMGIIRKHLWWSIPALFAGCLYFNSLHGGFFWDDNQLILDNPLIKTWSGTVSTFMPKYWNELHPGAKGQYRPLRNITFTLDYSFWHTDPFGYHMTNVLLHILCVVLVGITASSLFGSTFAGFLAAMLFAVHPVHIESINYVKNRSDLLCTLFFLMAFLSWQKEQRTKSVIYMFLSSLSKEFGVMLPIILSMHVLLMLPKERWKEGLLSTAPHYTLLCLFLAWKLFILVPTASTQVGIDHTIKDVEPVRLIISTVIAYTVTLFAPVHLSVDRFLPVISSLFAPGALAFYLISALGIWSITKMKGSKQLFFALLWIFICLAPVANFIPIKGRTFADQRLYLPSVGWALLLGGILAGLITGQLKAGGLSFTRILNRRTVAIIISFLFVTLGSFNIVRKNAVWQTTETLWAQATRDNPNNSRAWLNLAAAHMMSGAYDKAEKIYIMLLKDPQAYQSDDVFLNLGIIYQLRGDIKKALEFFQIAAKIDPKKFETWNNIGSMQLLLGSLSEAQKAFETALSLGPGHGAAGIYVNLGVINIKLEKYSAAEKYFREAVELNPDLIEARSNLAKIYRTFGMNFEAALQEREISLRAKTGSGLKPYNPEVAVR